MGRQLSPQIGPHPSRPYMTVYSFSDSYPQTFTRITTSSGRARSHLVSLGRLANSPELSRVKGWPLKAPQGNHMRAYMAQEGPQHAARRLSVAQVPRGAPTSLRVGVRAGPRELGPRCAQRTRARAGPPRTHCHASQLPAPRPPAAH